MATIEFSGMISGLSLSNSMEELALMYLATIQAIAHGTLRIIEELNEKFGHPEGLEADVHEFLNNADDNGWLIF